MAYTHVAHDCLVGDRTIFGNGATLAGHVGSKTTPSSAPTAPCTSSAGSVATRTSAASRSSPWTRCRSSRPSGHRPACFGLNRIGLQRKGFDEESLRDLESAYRTLTRSGMNGAQAVQKMRADHPDNPEVQYLVGVRGGVGARGDQGATRASPGARRTGRRLGPEFGSASPAAAASVSITCEFSRELDGVDLVGLFDPRSEVARDVASRFGASVLSSFEELVERIDAIVVAVPTCEHADSAARCSLAVVTCWSRSRSPRASPRPTG